MNKHVLLNAIAPAVVGGITALIFAVFGADLMSNLGNHLKSTLLFVWLLAVMMWCAYAVMQQGEAVAEELGEPLWHAHPDVLRDHHRGGHAGLDLVAG